MKVSTIKFQWQSFRTMSRRKNMNKYTLDVPADENDKHSGVRNMMNTRFDIDCLAQYKPSYK